MKGNEVVRMVPWKDGKANEGHSCVKGRFAWGYATHQDRITKPMIRAKITDPWREVSAGTRRSTTRPREFKRLQAKYGRDSIGGITSSRCTNEETYLVQKLVRAAFGNNNVDTCARVCHSPTGYGLKQTFGTSAGTQTFKSVEQGRRDHGDRRQPDRRPPGVRLAHEAAPARGREADRDRPAPHRPGRRRRTSRPTSTCSCARAPTSRVITALAHVIVTEGLVDEAFVAERCDDKSFARVARVRRAARELARGVREPTPACRPARVRGAARLYATGTARARAARAAASGQRRDLLRPRRDRARQGSTMVMGIANLAMVTGNVGREGVGVNPLRGQNNVQGSCDMGSFPHELPGYRHVSDADGARAVRGRPGA